jgi:DNA modification methylase
VIPEPFTGSGTSLIAAVKLGRNCRTIEISPAFVDVTIRRRENATVKQVMFEGSGRASDEVTADRVPGKEPATKES